MMVTAMRIPVPLPRAPMRSAATLRRPRMAPPKNAAVGITRLSSLYMLPSRCPAITLTNTRRLETTDGRHKLLTNHLLLLELFGDVTRAGSGDFNPGLGEECACQHHECDVEDGMDGVTEGSAQGVRGRHEVCDSRLGSELSRVLEGLAEQKQNALVAEQVLESRAGSFSPPKHRAT